MTFKQDDAPFGRHLGPIGPANRGESGTAPTSLVDDSKRILCARSTRLANKDHVAAIQADQGNKYRPLIYAATTISRLFTHGFETLPPPNPCHHTATARTVDIQSDLDQPPPINEEQTAPHYNNPFKNTQNLTFQEIRDWTVAYPQTNLGKAIPEPHQNLAYTLVERTMQTTLTYSQNRCVWRTTTSLKLRPRSYRTVYTLKSSSPPSVRP